MVIVFYVVGYILYAAAQNIGTIAGANIIYSFGYTGLQVCQTTFYVCWVLNCMW